jgi:hypothetical protein
MLTLTKRSKIITHITTAVINPRGQTNGKNYYSIIPQKKLSFKEELIKSNSEYENKSIENIIAEIKSNNEKIEIMNHAVSSVVESKEMIIIKDIIKAFKDVSSIIYKSEPVAKISKTIEIKLTNAEKAMLQINYLLEWVYFYITNPFLTLVLGTLLFIGIFGTKELIKKIIEYAFKRKN